MPELRKEPIIGRWVIISTERGKRPADYEPVEEPKAGGFCPFCPGNEEKMPPEILGYRGAGGSWSLRVIANKFPALRVEGELNREGLGLYDRMNGIGAHEIIIESPDHAARLATLPIRSFADVLWAYRERMADLKKDRRLRYALVFKNHGDAAGATLPHTHSQLIATPIVPKRVQEELDGARAYYEYKERCIFCDIIKQELLQKERVIAETESYVALAPFASRSPFETWILPRRHAWAYEDVQRSECDDLARLFAGTLCRLDQALRFPPYNFMLHTAPFPGTRPGGSFADSFHWHFEILPKLTKIAGFEWGSGFYINPTPPEEAASYLREIELPAEG